MSATIDPESIESGPIELRHSIDFRSAERHFPPMSPAATVGRENQRTSSAMPPSAAVLSASTRQAALRLPGSLPADTRRLHQRAGRQELMNIREGRIFCLGCDIARTDPEIREIREIRWCTGEW